jgi:formylglycine-generating enzyme required for sulfatase activity
MGTYEVSEDMITKANAEGSLGITKNTRGVDKPATSVSWNEAARFVNWMNTSSGYSAAYKFTLQPGDVGYNANADIILWDVADAGYDAANLYRNSNAFYFLPSENEWYKAAYYSGSGTTYFDYALQSDTIPTAVSGGASGAVYNNQTGPADVANAGGSSFYGTEAQNGNAWEWNESAFTAPNDSSSEYRAVRGGVWVNTGFGLSSTGRVSVDPASEGIYIGFRVASVPEPSTALVILIPLLGVCFLREAPERANGSARRAGKWGLFS